MNLAKFPIFLVRKLNFLRPRIFAMGSSHFSTAAEPSSIKRDPSGSLSCTGSGSTYSSLIGCTGWKTLQEVVEHACGMATLQMGEYVSNVSHGVDTYSIREPLGVSAGICPLNFPAMIHLWRPSNRRGRKQNCRKY